MNLINYMELGLLLAISLFTDIKTFKIKNSILISFAVVGIITNFVIGGVSALASSFLGAIIPILLLFILFALKMLGAGDIKMFASIGAIMGHAFVMPVLVYAFLAGGLLALFIMFCRGNLILRLTCFFNYLQLCYLTQSIQPYTEKLNNYSCSFRFSTAIIVGCIIQAAQIIRV